ncbi:hypothetical protein BaRGS_00007330, partial [Batillaria attramentaria]
ASSDQKRVILGGEVGPVSTIYTAPCHTGVLPHPAQPAATSRYGGQLGSSSLTANRRLSEGRRHRSDCRLFRADRKEHHQLRVVSASAGVDAEV